MDKHAVMGHRAKSYLMKIVKIMKLMKMMEITKNEDKYKSICKSRNKDNAKHDKK